MKRRKNKIFNNIQELADGINQTLHNDFDFPIAGSGITGSGKTTFFIQLAMHLAKLNEDNFDFNTNIAFTRTEIENNIKKLSPRYSLVLGDEMINAMYKRDFQNRKQINLIKLFNMCRYKNLCIGFAIPRFWSLDREVRQNYIKMWVNIEERGIARLFVPDVKDIFTEDVWHRKDNSKLIQMGKIYKSINYAGEIIFPDLSPEDKKKYIEIKESKSLHRVGKD